MVGRGRKKNARKAGQKEPSGSTKLNLILLLAEGKKSRQEILEHSRRELGISTARGIDKHLTELSNEGILVKELLGKGLEIYYSLNPDIGSLRKIIELSDHYEKTLAFMSSLVGKEMIGNCFLSNLVKEMIISLETQGNLLASKPIEERDVETDFLLSKLFSRYPEGSDEEECKKIHRNLYDQTFPIFVKDTLLPFEGRSEYDAKRQELCRMVAEMQFDSEFGTKALLPSLFQSYQDLVFHPDEGPEILEILRCSPTALKFIVTMEKNERLNSLYLPFYQTYLIYKDEEARDFREDKNKLEDLDEEVRIFSKDVLARTKTPTFLLQVLRGMLILDVSEYRYCKTPWLKEFLREPFTPIEFNVDMEHGTRAKHISSGGSV